jgi:hypothetical protein
MVVDMLANEPDGNFSDQLSRGHLETCLKGGHSTALLRQRVVDLCFLRIACRANPSRSPRTALIIRDPDGNVELFAGPAMWTNFYLTANS